MVCAWSDCLRSIVCSARTLNFKQRLHCIGQFASSHYSQGRLFRKLPDKRLSFGVEYQVAIRSSVCSSTVLSLELNFKLWMPVTDDALSIAASDKCGHSKFIFGITSDRNMAWVQTRHHLASESWSQFRNLNESEFWISDDKFSRMSHSLELLLKTF